MSPSTTPNASAGPSAGPSLRRTIGGLIATCGLSHLLALLLLAGLVYGGGVWNVLSGTRILDVLIEGGIIRYHDAHLGVVDGIDHPESYLRTQDPIDWRLVGVAVLIYLAYWVLRGVTFQGVARHVGAAGRGGAALRAWFGAQGLGRLIPHRFDQAAVEVALERDGATPRQVRRAFALDEALVWGFQILPFWVFGLFVSSYEMWMVQSVWALVILASAALIARGLGLGAGGRLRDARGALAALARSPSAFARLGGLSMLTMLMDDLTPFIIAMAFTGDQVILQVPFFVIQSGVVAGYIASRVQITPLGIGQFEWAFALALYASGVGFPEAATIALLDSTVRHLTGIAVALASRWRAAPSGEEAGASATGAPAGWTRAALARHLGEQAPAGAAGAAGAVDAAPEAADDAASEREGWPTASPPLAPPAATLWARVLALGVLAAVVVLLDQGALLLMDLWLLQSLGLESVFWTNFRMGGALFAAGLAASLAVIGPALWTPLARDVRRALIAGGALFGLLAAYVWSGAYLELLLTGSAASFGESDPVFGKDLGFYVFTLPGVWKVWTFVFVTACVGLAASVLAGGLAEERGPARLDLPPLAAAIARVSTRSTRAALVALGAIGAAGWWLARYDVLFMDNEASSIFAGAAYVDVTGLFSTLNDYWVTAAATLAGALAVAAALGVIRAAARGAGDGATVAAVGGSEAWWPRARALLLVALACAGADLAFKAAVRVRHRVAVKPNEPVIQLPYIERHIQATRKAYALDRIEQVAFIPKRGGDALPDLEKLLASPSLRNASLWPGFVSYVDDLIDPQHAKRILSTQDPMIYGPTLEVMRQQEKLRPYYDFMDVDTIRVPDERGDPRMLVTALREVPLVEPKPWLAWWGQQYMLFTHGHGLVAASPSEVSDEGDPVYVAGGVPVTSRLAALRATQPSVYYGEGAGSMAYSNVRRMQELDFPTDEGRAEVTFPEGVASGVRLDSTLKRLVFGWKSGQLLEVLFSDLIGPETRVHYFRRPLERVERVAPFLFLDSDPFAIPVDGGLCWMINGITWTDRYPYSRYEEIGDKSDERTPFPSEEPRGNYVRDAVKATVDAATGALKLYAIADEPIVRAWATVYPGLFAAAEEMPSAVRAQLQYPVQLFHTQLDDLFILYQMEDPMTFFNMEDMWDDGDEVLGPVLDQGHAIRFSIEPYYLVVDTTEPAFPTAKQPRQFAQAMVFTPENALNLRSLVFVYQDGEDYGRIVCLQVPKGHYEWGPEQADAAIDQDPDIAQQITWWTRRGVEVIRGHTTALVVDGELLYIEPMFLRSQQNPVTQLQRVSVFLRGKVAMAGTLREALAAVLEMHRRSAAKASGGT